MALNTNQSSPTSVSMLVSSMITMDITPSGVKLKTIKLVFVDSSLSMLTGWLGIRLMCLSGATCIPSDSCFSELAQ